MSISEAKEFFAHLKLNKQETQIAHQILKEINQRLQFLINVGLDYLTLSRTAGTLSGEKRSASGWPRKSDRNWLACCTF